MDLIDRSIRFLADIVWGPQTVILLLGTGLFLSIRLRFIHLRRIGFQFRLLSGRRGYGETGPPQEGDISPLQALTTSLATVVGNGNIALSFLLGPWINKPYNWIYCLFIIVGATLEVEAAWSVGDMFNGLMAITNLVGVVGLSGLAVRTVRLYLQKLNSPGTLVSS